MGRLLALVGGVGGLCAMALIAAAIQWSERPRVVPHLTTVPPLLRELNTPSPSGSSKDGESWIATRATSAHHVLVVEVNAAHLADSRDIAAQIVDKVADRRYDEVLVYFWSATAHRRFADRRVQWTRSGGYTELLMGD